MFLTPSPTYEFGFVHQESELAQTDALARELHDREQRLAHERRAHIQEVSALRHQNEIQEVVRCCVRVASRPHVRTLVNFTACACRLSSD